MIQAQVVVPMVNPAQIRPYASALLLKYTGNDPDSAVSVLARQLRTLKARERHGRAVTIIASGLTVQEPPTELGHPTQQEPGIESDGFISEVRQPPNWATADAPFTQTTLDLTIILRRRLSGPG
jgi:hypothetical protein